jgi:flagellar protein FlaG
MVKVIDNETQEVIQEIPPEKILDMVAKMWEVAGILVDERR